MGIHSKSLVNVVCSLLVLATNMLISFWLSPFIIEHIGIEANGFVTLANNFFIYACLITGALNSMAARFITLECIKKDYRKANLYYNSVFWGNLIIVAVLLLPVAYLIVRLETFVNITADILVDVKVLFSFIFFNFFINTGFPNWECGTYITNRLDRDYIPHMGTSFLKCIIIILMMTVLFPKVWYVGFATTVATIILLVVRRFNTHKLTPYLKIYLKKGERIISWAVVKELVSSGMWNSISSVGQMLLSGLDLLVCNIYLGATAMGVVALSKILPGCIEQLSSSVRSAFSAEITINYAKGDFEAMFRVLNKAMKMTSFIMITPIACVIVFGEQFFSLWVPSQDAKLLQVLSVLTIFGYMFTSGTQILYNVFGTVNKVKQNSIAILFSGVLSFAIMILLLKFTELGIYTVVGVSSCVNLVRNMVFTLPASAVYLGFGWKRFYPQVLQTIITSVVLVVIGFVIKPYLPNGDWINVIISISTFSTLAFLISSFILLNKNERLILKQKIFAKL